MTGRGLDASEARRRLADIGGADESFETTARRALSLGAAYLGVEDAYLARVDPATDHWEAVSVTQSADDGPVERVRNLRETYCRRTVERETTLAIHDTVEQGWDDDAAFETHHLHCYHGTPVTVDDEVYGTVSFVSETAREPFTDAETMFAELVASTLGRELERRRHERQLTRKSNLITVLNRVLRHNLRNSMAVIRGRTRELDGEFDDDSDTGTIVKHVDRLIELSDKARTLESIIVEEFERQDVDIGALVDRVARTVGGDHPSATVTVDCQTDLTIAVRPSLEVALSELVENAAIHTGEAPTVEVTVDAGPNEVTLRIADDGTGLADVEQQALTEGVETPLAHGTGLGLWLAHWVVTSHDGSIDLQNSEDGSVVTVRLPRETQTTRSILSDDDQKRLRRVQDKFRAVFEESSDALLVTDSNGRFIDVNQRASELFGMPKADLLGRSIEDFTPHGVGTDSIWEGTQPGGRQRGTLPLVRPDGTERTVEYTATTEVVPGQHLTVLRDVTRRERRKRELELSETVFQNVQDAVFLVDVTDESEFVVKCVNEAYERMTGLSNAAVQGKRPREIVGKEVGAEIESRYRECVERGETIRYPEEIPVGGDQRDLETKLTPIVEDGTVVELVGAMRDVTESVERKRELSQLWQVLERLLASAPVVFWMTDEDGVFTQSRGDALKRLGLDPGDIVGDSVFERFASHPDICDHVLRALDGECVTATVEVGDAVFESLYEPLRSEGELVGTVGFAYDVTEYERQVDDGRP